MKKLLAILAVVISSIGLTASPAASVWDASMICDGGWRAIPPNGGTTGATNAGSVLSSSVGIYDYRAVVAIRGGWNIIFIAEAQFQNPNNRLWSNQWVVPTPPAGHGAWQSNYDPKVVDANESASGYIEVKIVGLDGNSYTWYYGGSTWTLTGVGAGNYNAAPSHASFFYQSNPDKIATIAKYGDVPIYLCPTT